MSRDVSEFGRIGGKESGVSRTRHARVRQQQVIALHAIGMNQAEISRRLSVSPRTVFRDLAEVEDARIRVEEIIEDAGLDATDVHLTLSRMHDADLADIAENPEAPIAELRYKPIAKWPLIWRQGLAGKIKITPVAISDGERTEGGDRTMYRVEIERESLLKILELSAKLKQVAALAQEKAGDINIVVLSAERARQVSSAKKRLAKVIDVSARAISDGDTATGEGK